MKNRITKCLIAIGLIVLFCGMSIVSSFATTYYTEYCYSCGRETQNIYTYERRVYRYNSAQHELMSFWSLKCTICGYQNGEGGNDWWEDHDIVNGSCTTCGYNVAVKTTPTNMNYPAYVGKVVTMGNYPQDRNGTSKSPIEWYVIKTEGNYALLLSKMCLDTMPFDSGLRGWDSSSIKSWLNSDFMNTAFNASERNALTYYNPASAKVFLLSRYEVENYVSTLMRMGYTTAYANSSNTKGRFPATVGQFGYAMWWLRDDGTDYGASMCVRADMDVSITTRGMNRDRDYYTVRPAIWVDTTLVNLR